MNELFRAAQARAAALKKELAGAKPAPAPRLEHQTRALAMRPEIVRQFRKAAGLTQMQLAKRLRVSMPTMKRYEKTGIPMRARRNAAAIRRLKPAAPLSE